MLWLSKSLLLKLGIKLPKLSKNKGNKSKQIISKSIKIK